MAKFVCAVDVGTRSARAAFFDAHGHMSAREVAPIHVTVEPDGLGAYHSAEIWSAVCRAVRLARSAAGVQAGDVGAVAFDGTCSLVLMDREGDGLPFGDDGTDTFAWFDRRAVAQAEACTRVGGRTVDLLGAVMSPEMQLPKLMWLRETCPDVWSRFSTALDLPDWLAFRATGAVSRSVSALGAKWPWSSREGWDDVLFDCLGLDDLRATPGWATPVRPVGSVAGHLSPEAASDMRLSPGIPVAVGMIDGYAGAMGCRSMALAADVPDALTLIAGTSASVIALRPVAVSLDGLWGPFRDVPTAGLTSHEGGITNAGALLDHVLTHWPEIGGSKIGHPAVIAEIETHLARRGHAFASDLHVLPDFVGSRGPVGNPRWRGVVHGLRLDSSLSALAGLYWRTAVALAISIGDVIDRFGASGLEARAIAATGGLMQSDLIAQLFADVTDKTLILPVGVDAVLLGTAMAGAVAAGWADDMDDASHRMAPEIRTLERNPATATDVARDRRVHRLMQKHRAEIAGLQE
ncbi:FGGY-family carbohydrate kinase [uncultured Maritimibacter sp.]|uniref:FGGY-family carbohydrate kinase n=1 Tax=uncultured Maritimibacter sp. TaxID=991866 RepID=UPI002593B3D2|nr:FGGY-family carbohydrate kinase [uncultured Maritimibacter sp.]